MAEVIEEHESKRSFTPPRSQTALSKEFVEIDNQSISHKNVIEVNRKMLAPAKPGKVNPIATKNVFDTVGSNGIS